jgi:hypothetical protein
VKAWKDSAGRLVLTVSADRNGPDACTNPPSSECIFHRPRASISSQILHALGTTQHEQRIAYQASVG